MNRELPHLGNAGQERLAAYLSALAHRLQRVRIACGSWQRVVQPSVIRSGAGGDGARAIFLDPPYATSGDLYATDHTDVAADVAAWCATAPSDLRIGLCGYDDEHAALEAIGWRCVEGKAGGGAGYSVRSDNGRRERIWFSPACLGQHQDVLDFGAAS